ncbi:HNH endonuclease [Aeromonas dhakensis]|uniref:HNH endonuclease n=1 Tax=Aeromonas dhakensis TaxID=196024 RepID=UPI003BA3DFF8
MRTIPKPSLKVNDVYLTCISKVRSKDLKNSLKSIVSTIESDADIYEAYADSKEWFLFDESDSVDSIVSCGDMEKIYTNRMVKKDSPGRLFYDTIKESAQFNICPLCGHRSVEQLDHYLPKSKFPSLVVLPINLIPSCEKCNKIKLDDSPKSSQEQTLHPYYDDVTSHQWLFADVIEGTPASFKFRVEEVTEFDDELNDRIKYHFNTLELNSLYISQTGAFISDIRYRLIDLHQKVGMNEVRSYLREEEISRSRNNINSWQRAMFQALADSDWFCDGGFNL